MTDRADARPRHIVKLKDGRRIDALDVEYSSGWLTAVAIRRRLELDDTGGRHVFDGVERRTVPASAVREVVDLDPEARR